MKELNLQISSYEKIILDYQETLEDLKKRRRKPGKHFLSELFFYKGTLSGFKRAKKLLSEVE